MDEQARFQEWWESTGTNSVILRAQAWSAWLARAEVDKPQPAEDPDEWVILDPVKYANHVLRWNIDFTNTRMGWEPITIWAGDTISDILNDYECTNVVFRCRRRDLPKVEQADQWPKYYETIALGPDAACAFVRRETEGNYVIVYKNGMESDCHSWINADNSRRELTEAEAMALLNKPQPQPQKTRVRLWMRNEPKGRPSLFACDERPYPDSHKYVEIHHDSEGFYVENQS